MLTMQSLFSGRRLVFAGLMVLVAWFAVLSTSGIADDKKPARGKKTEEETADKKKTDAELLVGVWIPSSMKVAGKELPAEVVKTITVELTAEKKYISKVGDKTDEGDVKIDDTATPKTMDLTGTSGPNKDKTFPCIYRMDGDTLTVCYNLFGADRPTSFDSTEANRMTVVVYDRKKK